MLRKILLIGCFAFFASFYLFGPEWVDVSAQSPNQTIPVDPNALALQTHKIFLPLVQR